MLEIRGAGHGKPVLCLVLLTSLMPRIAFCADDSPASAAPQVARPVKITISKETTCLTEPIRPDGWLDYAAAINERCRRGATAENNAAIPLWRAVGPKDVPKERREQFFKLLGIPPLPEEGQYLVQLGEYLLHVKDAPAQGTAEWNQWFEDIYDQSRKAQSRPWSGKEFPVLAAWLDSNEKPLESILAAAGRSRFFEPLVVKPNGSLLDALDIRGHSSFRSAVELLRLRTMRQVAAGKIDDARQDLLACHRLARLEAQKALLIDEILARALERSACDGDVALIHYGHLTSEKLEQYHRALRALPAMPPMDTDSLAERFFSLDTLRNIATGDPMALRLTNILRVDDRAKEARAKLLADRRIDWDVVFREYNSNMDKQTEACRQPTLLKRREALKKLDDAASAAAHRVDDPADLAKLLAPETSSRKISQQLAAILLEPELGGSGVYIWAEGATAVKVQLTNFAFALAEYHNDRAAYPRTLAELSPKYLHDVPQDPWSDQEYIYRPRDNAYLLYSVGRNGKDDGGESSLDNPKKYAGVTDLDKLPDDIAIRTPEAGP
jgi:hypothetical protein